MYYLMLNGSLWNIYELNLNFLCMFFSCFICRAMVPRHIILSYCRCGDEWMNEMKWGRKNCFPTNQNNLCEFWRVYTTVDMIVNLLCRHKEHFFGSFYEWNFCYQNKVSSNVIYMDSLKFTFDTMIIWWRNLSHEWMKD
jgi:hypothetical protein